MKKRILIVLSCILVVLLGLGIVRGVFGYPLRANDLNLLGIYEEEGETVFDLINVNSAVCITDYRYEVQDRTLVLRISGGLNQSLMKEVRVDVPLNDLDSLKLIGFGEKNISLTPFKE